MEGLPKWLPVEASGFDGIDSESGITSSPGLLLTPRQVDWEHPSNPEQGRDFLALLKLLYDFTSQTSVTSYQRLCRLGNGHCRTSIFTKLKTTSTCSISWPTTLQVHGHRQQDTMRPARSPGNPGEASGSAAVEYLLSLPASRPRKYSLGVPASMDDRSWGATGPGQTLRMARWWKKEPSNSKQLPRQGTEEIVNTRVVSAFCICDYGGFHNLRQSRDSKNESKLLHREGTLE